MPLPRGLLKSLIRQGMSAPEAMKEAWRQVRLQQDPERFPVRVQRKRYAMRRTVNPGARWHEDRASDAGYWAERSTGVGRTYQLGQMDAHQFSARVSRRLGMNPRRNEYQGWTNWETWNINLWAMNEEPAYRYIMARRPFIAESAKRVAVELFPRGTPDMQHRGLPKYEWVPKVNWREIAESWNEGYEGNANIARPSAIPPHKLAAANRFVNMIRNAKKRAYGFAYLTWLKGGAIGDSPDPPAGLSVMAAQAVRMELDAMGLWENRKLGSRSRYRHERLEPKQRFDPRSFRTVRSGKALITVGCPKGHYDPGRDRCKVGTRAQRIMHPKGNPRGSQDILLIKPTGDPYGRGWEGIQSTDGGQTWFYRGDLGRRSRAWWRAYARRMGYTLRVENPLTRPEAASVIRDARTQYSMARQMKKGGPSRAYYMGAGDGMLSVARTHGPARTRIPRRTMKLNPPRLIGPIPGVMRRLEYRRTKDRPGLYYHNFKRGVRAYALSDGSVLLRGPKPLYVNQ